MEAAAGLAAEEGGVHHAREQGRGGVQRLFELLVDGTSDVASAESERWTLYCFDSNSKAHRYEPLEPYRPMSRLLEEIEKDPTAIFWG
jgi:hypothetical protein